MWIFSTMDEKLQEILGILRKVDSKAFYAKMDGKEYVGPIDKCSWCSEGHSTRQSCLRKLLKSINACDTGERYDLKDGRIQKFRDLRKGNITSAEYNESRMRMTDALKRGKHLEEIPSRNSCGDQVYPLDFIPWW